MSDVEPGRPADVSPPEELADVARRIARAIAQAEAAAPESQPRAILFHAGALSLALPLASIREVLNAPAALSKVPRAPAALLGIMNLRGRVVAVVDLLHALPGPIAARLGSLPPTEAPGHDLSTGRVLLLDRNRREVGLLVRSVEGIAPLPAGQGSGPLLLDADEVAAAIEALVT